MNLLGIGSIIDSVGKIADNLVTTKEEKLRIALQEKAMDVGLVHDQIEVNKAEAKHSSLFVAGWRPAIGWTGALAMAYQFILYPLLVWVWAVLQAYQLIPCNIGISPGDVVSQCSFMPPPTLPSDALFAIVTGMLGIGGMRSYDKLNKTDTKNVRRSRG